MQQRRRLRYVVQALCCFTLPPAASPGLAPPLGSSSSRRRDDLSRSSPSQLLQPRPAKCALISETPAPNPVQFENLALAWVRPQRTAAPVLPRTGACQLHPRSLVEHCDPCIKRLNLLIPYGAMRALRSWARPSAPHFFHAGSIDAYSGRTPSRQTSASKQGMPEGACC